MTHILKYANVICTAVRIEQLSVRACVCAHVCVSEMIPFTLLDHTRVLKSGLLQAKTLSFEGLRIN